MFLEKSLIRSDALHALEEVRAKAGEDLSSNTFPICEACTRVEACVNQEAHDYFLPRSRYRGLVMFYLGQAEGVPDVESAERIFQDFFEPAFDRKVQDRNYFRVQTMGTVDRN